VFKPLSLIVILLFISACKPVVEQDSALQKEMPLPQCIKSQSQCEISTEIADFSVKFSQLELTGNIKSELPFIIELSQVVSKVTEPQLTKLSAYLEGKDMFMGKVPVFFEKGEGDNKFTGNSLLANCTEEQMVWRLWLTVESIEHTQTFFVDFTSQRL